MASKIYVVFKGNNPGKYTTWEDCKKEVHGFAGAIYKSYKTNEEATQAMMDFDGSLKRSNKKDSTTKENKDGEIKPIKGLSVDGACSGNPGKGEYRCVDIATKEVIFSSSEFEYTTNNLMEYFALVEVIKYKIETKSEQDIWSDSKTAIAWVRNKKIKTTLKKTSQNFDSFALMEKYEKYIENIEINFKIKKWDTKAWGEIPADFGRK